MAAVNSPQDSDLPSYGQAQGIFFKTGLTPISGVRATLETMLEEVNKDLGKVITILQESSSISSTGFMSRDLFVRMGMLHLYRKNSRDDTWKDIQDERLRLLERKDYLRIELAKVTAQEQQQEHDLQAWLEVDCIRTKRLVFIDALMEGLQTILQEESKPKPKPAPPQDSLPRTNVIFDQILTLPEGRGFQPFSYLKQCDSILTLPEGRGIQPFVHLKYYDSSIRKYCVQELERLGSIRDELAPVTMRLKDAPPGAWDRRATASSIPLNNHYMARPPSFSSTFASSSPFTSAPPAPSATPIYAPRQL
ncbi:hypothetical protein EMPS_04898 [Entomortierella parvispora]|uniref:Uncharacterized protein n=1 Tax=Entomortierella parvispora TaxID=205924 RepID=A0A9P3H9E0_9FUNG|nr:hypothetical protein EMPS_04898 [Entomortierella parvispora]